MIALVAGRRAVIVGVVGLGRMGSAIARRLAEKEFSLVLWTRDKKKLEVLAKETGGEIASSPKEVAEKADYTHIVVSDDHALYEVVAGVGGVLASNEPTVIINHVTCTIRASLSVARIASLHMFSYVEAPIIGGPSAVRRGEAIIPCSSDDKELCEAETLLSLGDVIYLGRPPKALAAKLGFNHVFLSIVTALADAFSLVEAYGIEWENYVNLVLSKTWIKQVIERYGDRLRLGSKASFVARLAGKDARYAAEALAELGLDASLAAAVANHYAAMVREGYGDADYPSIADFFAMMGRRLRERKTEP